MTTQNINFNAFDDKDSIIANKPPLNRLTDWLPQPLRIIAQVLLLFVTIILIFAIPLIVIIFIAVVFTSNPWIGMALGGLVALGFALFYRRQRGLDKNAKVGLKGFARQNGWAYGPVGKLIQKFNNGKFVRSATENNATLYSIKGQLQAHDFELLVGWKDAKNAPLEPLTPELFIKSQRQLPNAVLVSKHVTDGSKIFDRMFAHFDKPMPVSLEGDFDKFFQLYVPSGEQVDALSLIAPDFMQTAISFSDKLTIEMSTTGFALLPIYSETLTKQAIAEMFTAAEKLLTETDY